MSGKHNTGTFPVSPVNMGEINSTFDDYNSISPVIGETFPLCFSSKRNSEGADFDIVYKLLDVLMDRSSGKLTVAENTNGNMTVFAEYANLLNAVSHINTSHDELGPYLLPAEKYSTSFIFLYSNNEGGGQDIRFVHNLENHSLYTYPMPVSYLNSSGNDAYPALNQDNSAVYFCSDRAGDFDIYKVMLDTDLSLLQKIGDTVVKTVFRETGLSSTGNDKCPFILDKLMVFTSDRVGGYGGYDLYYSVFSNDGWSEPVNFGDKINTKYDEYRPIVNHMYEFTNDFMIFSSNRPGGKGGFDLYYVGIDRSIGE
jgi:hypothetical protein